MPGEEFRQAFDAYLDRVLAEPIGEDVDGFCFNLAQPWSIGLIGAVYRADDPDWPCAEVFRPRAPSLELPGHEVGSDWETVQRTCKRLIERYLEGDRPGARRLKRAACVAIGFVDGDLEPIRSR